MTLRERGRRKSYFLSVRKHLGEAYVMILPYKLFSSPSGCKVPIEFQSRYPDKVLSMTVCYDSCFLNESERNHVTKFLTGCGKNRHFTLNDVTNRLRKEGI